MDPYKLDLDANLKNRPVEDSISKMNRHLYSMMMFFELFVSLIFFNRVQGNPGQLLEVLYDPLACGEQFGSEIASTLDGNIVVGMPRCSTGKVIIVDSVTGALLLEISNPSSVDYFGSDVEVMPSGNLLVTASGYNEDGAAYVINATDGTILLTLTEHIDIANNGDFIAATPDNNIIVGAVYESGGTVYLFDGTDGHRAIIHPNAGCEMYSGFICLILHHFLIFLLFFFAFDTCMAACIQMMQNFAFK